MDAAWNSNLAQGDLLELSNHPLVVDGKNLLYAGLTVTLFIDHNAGTGLNERLGRCMDEYLKMVPEPPRSASLPNANKIADFSKRALVPPSEAIASRKEGAEWDATYIWAASEHEAAPWSMETVRGSHAETWALSYFHVSFPMTWAAKPELIEAVRRWSETLSPVHGYAGVGLLLAAAPETQAKLDSVVCIAAQRFPGINVDYPALQRGVLRNGIKTVDWLTVLGRDFVEKLGGRAALLTALGPQFSAIPLSTGGLLIQSGALPQLGDMEKGKRPEAYVALNRLLKPVRIVEYPYAFQSGQFSRPYMDRTVARVWIARFD